MLGRLYILTCIHLNYSTALYYLFMYSVIHLTYPISDAASGSPYVPLEITAVTALFTVHAGCFFSPIKSGSRPHPVGCAVSPIESLQYISLLLSTTAAHKSVHRFCIPKWLLEQQQATVQDKWGQAHCNFHINHGWRQGLNLGRNRGRGKKERK